MIEEAKNRLTFIHGDRLLSFKTDDLFPKDDPLARDLIRLLTVDADLQAVREVEEEMPERGSHPISQIKWGMRFLFLLKLRMGFLSNTLDEIIAKQYKNRSSLGDIVSSLSEKTRRTYAELREAMRARPRAQEIMSKFRNKVVFHYDDQAVEKALANMCSEEGKLVLNGKENEVHCVVGYQVSDLIPAGRFSSDLERQRIMDDIDLIQGRLHVFTFHLFNDYIESRHLKEKITITIDP